MLKKGNDIEKSTVFEELGNFNKVDEHSDDDDDDYDDDDNEWFQNQETKFYSDFKSSEAVLITNAKKPFGTNCD